MARSRARKNTSKTSFSNGNARIKSKGRKRNKKIEGCMDLDNNSFYDKDVLEQQVVWIRTVRNFEIEHLLTELDLFISCFGEEQKQLQILEIFQKYMPNLSLEKDGRVANWLDAGVRTSLLPGLSAGFPGRSSGLPSFRDSFSSDFFPMVGGRTSVGMTPKTVRLPKPGEMILSVGGSPLGVFKGENMGIINESEEDRSGE